LDVAFDFHTASCEYFRHLNIHLLNAPLFRTIACNAQQIRLWSHAL
jgi:hypothetical protein